MKPILLIIALTIVSGCQQIAESNHPLAQQFQTSSDFELPLYSYEHSSGDKLTLKPREYDIKTYNNKHKMTVSGIILAQTNLAKDPIPFKADFDVRLSDYEAYRVIESAKLTALETGDVYGEIPLQQAAQDVFQAPLSSPGVHGKTTHQIRALFKNYPQYIETRPIQKR